MTKKKLIALLLISLVLLLLIYLKKRLDGGPVSFIADGEKFTAEVNGGELILGLASNPSTGYSWEITETPDNFASDYNDYYEASHEKDVVGAGGTDEFHIIALKEGTGTMTFQYRRPWEDSEAAETYELTLEISRRDKTQLQIDSVSFVCISESDF